jgi:hypothetical protein
MTMAKAVDDSVLDAAMDNIATSTVMHICSAQPSNFAGIAAVSLANVTMAGGDYVKAAGSPTGRKVTVGAKSAIPVTASGTANHVALATGTVLKYVTTATAQALTSGNTVSTPAWAVTIAAPT